MTPSRAHDENVVNIAITIAATIVTTTVITATATIVVAHTYRTTSRRCVVTTPTAECRRQTK